MNDNILMLPQGGRVPAVREIDREDLYVEFLQHHKGHIQRRKDRQDAHRRAAVREREDREQQMRDLAMVSQFSAFGVLVTLGLLL